MTLKLVSAARSKPRNSSTSRTGSTKMLPTYVLVTLIALATLQSCTSVVSAHSPRTYLGESAEPLAADYYDDEEQSVENSNKIIPWRQINFISPSQELAQTRWWYEAPLDFSARGMDHLYLLNQLAMAQLQPPGVPSEILKDELFSDPLMLAKGKRTSL